MLKVPIVIGNLAGNLAVALAIFNPTGKTLQPVNKGITRAESTTVRWELGNCRTDVWDFL